MYVHFIGNVDVLETLYDPDDDILSAMRDAADAEFPGCRERVCGQVRPRGVPRAVRKVRP